MPAQAPAATPAPGVQAIAARQVAADEGRARGTVVGLTRYQLAPYDLAPMGSEQPFQGVPRYSDRPAMHPAGPVGTLDQTDKDWSGFGGTTGAHGALVVTTGTPQGSQEPYGSNPRTFRAQPGPWDAGIVTAGSPSGQVVGDE